MDWEELNHGLFTALRIQQIVMSVVLALIIVVAAFTVIATLIMVVLDKKKEIAVLKAMGATDGAILRIFLYQGGIIGARRARRSGSSLGFVVCKGLARLRLPARPQGVLHLAPAGGHAPDRVRAHGRLRHRHLPGRDRVARDVRVAAAAGRSVPRAVKEAPCGCRVSDTPWRISAGGSPLPSDRPPDMRRPAWRCRSSWRTGAGRMRRTRDTGRCNR